MRVDSPLPDRNVGGLGSARLRESCCFVRGAFSLESSLVLLEEILSLEGGGSTSRMCTLVTAHGAPIGLGSGRSERMPIT